MQESEPTKICSWEFDNYSGLHWQEQKEGNVDKTKSWIDFANTDMGNRITIFTDRNSGLVIDADRDQWGTWITFSIGDSSQTIAQEDGTMSFIDGLIAALTKFRKITDINTKPPLLSYDVCDACDGCGEILEKDPFKWVDCPKCKTDLS
jgi:hypothetical protein